MKPIINIDVTESGLAELDELRRQLKKDTIGETIRTSLKIAKYMSDELDRGRVLILRDKITKEEREVVLK